MDPEFEDSCDTGESATEDSATAAPAAPVNAPVPAEPRAFEPFIGEEPKLRLGVAPEFAAGLGSAMMLLLLILLTVALLFIAHGGLESLRHLFSSAAH